jgi:hypothetical protein
MGAVRYGAVELVVLGSFRKFWLCLHLLLLLFKRTPAPAVLVDETLPSMLGAPFACNVRVTAVLVSPNSIF